MTCGFYLVGLAKGQLTKIFRIFLGLSLLGLFSCTHHLPLGQSRIEVAQCQLICKQHLISCEKSCRNNCNYCETYANHKAKNRYAHYINEQDIRGGLVIRRLNSYRDPLQCRKSTCNCSTDYQVCVQSCGGVVHKLLTAPPVCS